jgi:hypothetical protein
MIILVFIVSFAVTFGAARFLRNNVVPVIVFALVLLAMYGPWHWARFV